ncbi:MAG TPA: glycerophosphodiester phosphodiesterase [Bacillota bacterium]|nr:glycerophosphodiester phosphodiesterase [Bacillota bacterium]
MKRPIIYAHRGASASAPENTGAAFRAALDMKAGGIELDLHLSKDGELVVIHDESVNRTSNGSGLVKDLLLEDLRKLDFGSWFDSKFKDERILTLDECLDMLRGWDGILNAELKTGPILYKGIEEKLVNTLKDHDMIEKSIVSSFNHYSLLLVKQLEPQIKTGTLYMAGLVEPWEYAKKVGAEAIHPYFPNILPPIVEGCKENGIMMNPFTVDEPAHIAAMARAGVDGIITNVPDLAIKTISDLT